MKIGAGRPTHPETPVTRRTLALDDTLHAYLLETSLREVPRLAALRAETAALGEAARMQIAPEQGQLMALLVRFSGARRILEIGTFTGYSTTVMALALPPDGRILTCDVSPEWTAVARRAWQDTGVDGRIELRLGPALDTLQALAQDPGTAPFDMAFIDADKESYRDYYEHALALVRPGGLVMLDNVLWGGAVADPERQDPATAALRSLNAFLKSDERVDLALVPVGDGVTLARKRGQADTPTPRSPPATNQGVGDVLILQ